MYGRQMGLDLGTLDLGSILGNSAGSAFQQFQTSLIGQVAATPQVQQAVAQSAQQAAATSLADKLLANKNLFLYGGIAVVGLLAFSVLRK